MNVLFVTFFISGGAYFANTLSIYIINPIEVNPFITFVALFY
jgi:hypothetical protein